MDTDIGGPDELSPNHIRRIKLDLDERALALAEEQVARLTQTTASLEGKLAQIQLSLATSRATLSAVTLRRDALLLDVREQRASLSAVERIPEEIMGQIFEYSSNNPAAVLGNLPVRSSGQRARAPFICAAVCKRWRQAALGAPRIWRYVAIPQLTQGQSDGERFLYYVETMLERSKSIPLLIIFDMIDYAGSRHHGRLLEALSAHLLRWKAFSARIYEQRALPTLLDCLRGPAPMLDHVFVGVRPGDNYELTGTDHAQHPGLVPPNYLCHAPRLRCLCVENLPLSWYRGHKPMLALEYLSIRQRTLTDAFWTTIAAAKAVKILVVVARELPPAPQEPVELPSLTVFNLGSDVWKLIQRYPDALVVPALETLASPGRPADLEPFLVRVSASLTTLRLNGAAIDGPDIPPLAHLAALRHLHLFRGTVTPLLFDRLGAREECMWPRLEELTLDGVALQPAHGDSLVELVRRRKGGDSAEPGTTVPWCALRTVAFFGPHNVPRWDVAEVARLLGQT